MHIKIYGAGSIGNHLAHAASSLDWMVDVYDVDEKALNRMKNDIFPNRYGRWNDNIRLFNNSDMQKINYDYIVIGTPPDIHVKLLYCISIIHYHCMSSSWILDPTSNSIYLCMEILLGIYVKR